MQISMSVVKVKRSCSIRRYVMIGLMAMLMLSVAGCQSNPADSATVGVEETQPPPTSTSVVPTPVPPTATPVPPTDTPVPPTATSVPPTDTRHQRPHRRRSEEKWISADTSCTFYVKVKAVLR